MALISTRIDGTVQHTATAVTSASVVRVTSPCSTRYHSSDVRRVSEATVQCAVSSSSLKMPSVVWLLLMSIARSDMSVPNVAAHQAGARQRFGRVSAGADDVVLGVDEHDVRLELAGFCVLHLAVGDQD